MKVDTAETVHVLKELIILGSPNYFKGIDPVEIDLWKACIPKQKLSNFRLSEDDILDPMAEVREVFPGLPPKQQVHIIIKSFPARQVK